MVCTARARSQLYEVDAKWMVKFRLRIAHNIFCVASIGAAGIVLGRSSNYQPNAWKYSRAVAYYIPFVILTFIWNIANIIFLVKQHRPLKHAANAVVHFILAAAIIIAGSIATAYCVQGYKNTGIDPYGINVGTGVHDITALNGTIITVSPENAHNCPAFPSCEIQKRWTMSAGRRAVIAVIGCALLGIAFIFNVVFFVYGCNDAVFGTKPAAVKLDDEKNREWKSGKRMTLNGRPIMISDPKLVSAPWMKSQHHLLEERKAAFGQDNGTRSSFSLAIFASAPGSPKHAPPRAKSKSGAKSFHSRESHGSIYAVQPPGHIQIHDQGSRDSLSSLPSPLPVYDGKSFQGRGDASPRYSPLPPSAHHSMDVHHPSTPHQHNLQSRALAQRDLPTPPSPLQSQTETSHCSMNLGPSPLPTRPTSLALSIAPTVFNRKSTATQLSMDTHRTRGAHSVYSEDDAASVYTTIDRMASFRSMPRISTGPDFSADWNELGIDVPPVPEIPSRANTIKSSKAPSLHPSQDSVPPMPQVHASQDHGTNDHLNPFSDSNTEDGSSHKGDVTLSQRSYDPRAMRSEHV